jgi:NAD(P)-dependent dehydrogenase (short-subunit alcohol dehydrogenase family)
MLCTDVDFKGVVYGTQLAIHFMRKNATPGGTIVCTASVAALYPHETYPEYDGAKAAVLSFVYATSRLLKNKENISIGAVLPGIVRTNIIPPEMVAAVSPEMMTPVSTIVSAYQRFLDEPELAGQAIECSVTKHFLVPRPEYVNGAASKRACTVWEPLFKMIHGENSELDDAIA